MTVAEKNRLSFGISLGEEMLGGILGRNQFAGTHAKPLSCSIPLVNYMANSYWLVNNLFASLTEFGRLMMTKWGKFLVGIVKLHTREEATVTP